MYHHILTLENLTTIYEGVLYTEEWMLIAKLQNRYLISSFGRVKRKARCHRSENREIPEMIVKPSKGKYLKLRRVTKSHTFDSSIHRLVAAYFVPNPLRKRQVNHIDTIKYNNFFKNLEWCTQSENNKHAVERNLCWQGGLKHLSFADRRFIKENFISEKRDELATMFNITEKQVYSIGTNRDTLLEETRLIGAAARKKRKKCKARFKPIVDIETGAVYNSEQVAKILGIRPKYVYRMLSEERKPNTSKYRYA